MSRSLSPSVRASLLETADRLLYEHGIVSTGIDRLCRDAGIGKPALYRHFGSKDALVVAYLQRRHLARRDAILAQLDKAGSDPEARVTAVVDWLCDWMRTDGFRGCSFLRALSESAVATDTVVEVTRSHKAWMQRLLADELAPITAQPARTARHVFLLIEGAVVTATYDDAEQTARELRRAIEVVLDSDRRQPT